MKQILLTIFLLSNFGCSGQNTYTVAYQKRFVNSHDTIEYLDFDRLHAIKYLPKKDPNEFENLKKKSKANIFIYPRNGKTFVNSFGNGLFYFNPKQKIIKYNISRNIHFNPNNNWNTFDTVIVVDSMFTIQWNLEDEFKRILNYQCQKAKGYFRGRNYIAWFTSEIPYSYGPLNFNGLPGLILEIYDEDNLFSFQTIRIHKTNKFIDSNIILQCNTTITFKDVFLLTRKERRFGNQYRHLQQKSALPREYELEDTDFIAEDIEYEKKLMETTYK